jgi:hypothetical protein
LHAAAHALHDTQIAPTKRFRLPCQTINSYYFNMLCCIGLGMAGENGSPAVIPGHGKRAAIQEKNL